MSHLILPDSVRAEVEQDSLIDSELGKREWLDREVRHLDHRLSVVWVKDRCDPSVAEMYDLKPGRWHVKRDNPGLEPSFKAITGPHGEYRSPDSGVLEELRGHDMWNDDVARRLFERNRRAQAARDRADALAREQRRDTLKEDVKAKLSPGVSFSDVRWSNSPAGRRGRNGGG